MADVASVVAPRIPDAIYAGVQYTATHLTVPTEKQNFDPDKHLVHNDIVKTLTMDDIGLPMSNGVSSMAVSEPFPLFTTEAIDIMRAEVFTDEVMTNYSRSSDLTPLFIRGYVPKYAKFTEAAWKHPKTLDLISKIAGIDLAIAIDYEIANINISLPAKTKEGSNGTATSTDELPVVGWHKDSYPFVCVLMMSDTTGMVGGETALRTGNGEIKLVRGPCKGSAVILQGRYIEHQALRAYGSQERITSITSFRPRDPLIRDDTRLTTIRPISNLIDVYTQVEDYQLENLKARIDAELAKMRQDKGSGKYDCERFKAFAREAVRVLQHLDNEIVDEALVKKGSVVDTIRAELTGESLGFLDSYQYPVTADGLLTGRGASTEFAAGVSFWNKYGRTLYNATVGQLAYNASFPDGTARSSVVLRTTSQAKIHNSMINWALGFFAIYLCDTTERLQNLAPEGLTFSTNDTYAMQTICAYENAFMGMSEFCGFFTADEWAGYENTLDISYYYDYGYGNPTGRAQGIGYVTELLACLNHTLLYQSTTSVNYTITNNVAQFPLDQKFYADFSHDDIIISALAAISIDYFRDPPSLTEFPPNPSENSS
ncbi:hypothetical protein IFR05_013579 [Cadophora sp. M221]|nr:hypothetical protein IFR05_013579 [Cadophora sp. M221]